MGRFEIITTLQRAWLSWFPVTRNLSHIYPGYHPKMEVICIIRNDWNEYPDLFSLFKVGMECLYHSQTCFYRFLIHHIIGDTKVFDLRGSFLQYGPSVSIHRTGFYINIKDQLPAWFRNCPLARELYCRFETTQKYGILL